MPTQRNNKKKNSRQRQLLLVIAFVVLVSLGAQISFDLGGDLNLTLQTLFLAVTFYYMKLFPRILAVVLYLGLGIAGFAIFSNGGSGMEHFTGPGMGFFIGFVLASFIRPIKGNFQNILTYALLVHIVIAMCGIITIAIVNKDINALTQLGFALLPGLVIKSLLVALICTAIGKWLTGNSLDAG